MKNARPEDFSLLLLRLTVGPIMILAGYPKLMNFSGTMEGLAGFLNLPPALAWLPALAIIAEFFGGIALLVGALTRFAAAGVAATMAVAAYTKIQQVAGNADLSLMEKLGEIMWPGALGIMALAVLISGAGRFAVDPYLFKKRKR